MLFSLKLQRDNRKNALIVEPAKGKTGKKLYFSTYCGDETTTYSNRAFLYLDGSRSGTLWEHAESTPSRSAGGLKPMALKGALNRLIRGWAAPWKKRRESFPAFCFGPVMAYGCFISTVWRKYRRFLQFSVDGLHDWGILLVIPLGFQERKH